MIDHFFSVPSGRPARIAVFMSGSGTNAEALLRYYAEHPENGCRVTLLVTDAPETSRARRLSADWGVPLLEHDIRAFYAARGETAISLVSERRRAIRAEWTDCLCSLLAPHAVDFGVLAGFVPLCNITADLPCLNVHPGDLTVEENGRRILAGLHFRPVETAILAGYASLRSSVILAQPFEGNGEAEMDSGPVLGVSTPVPVDLDGESVAALAAVRGARQHAPYRDRLRDVAARNLERLKIEGDHVVLPRVVADFAAGRFGRDRNGGLYFREAEQWLPCRTVEYGRDGRNVLA